MESIKDKVSIVGMGCCKFGELWDKSREDLIVEAAYEAFEDAGIGPKDVQAAWFGTQVSAYSGQVVAHALKLPFIPITRVENQCATGQDAFRNACYAVAGGFYDIAMVCGMEKLKDEGFSGLGSFPINPGESPTKVNTQVQAPARFAQLASRYFSRYGLSAEEGKRTLAKIAVKNHHNGSMNAKAHLQREVTLEQVINAPMMSYPLGLFDCCGVSDGCAVAIITRPEIAKKLNPAYVNVKGLGLSCGYVEFVEDDQYDMTHVEETVHAARQAYTEAGIKDPRKEIHMAEVHDCFTITEMVIYEDLGFSPRGKAKEDIDAGFFTLEGGLPVNPDGGLKSFGHPVGASGLRMMYEIYKQIQGKAGPRQLKRADNGLCHSLGGHPLASFTAGITIIGRA